MLKLFFLAFVHFSCTNFLIKFLFIDKKKKNYKLISHLICELLAQNAKRGVVTCTLDGCHLCRSESGNAYETFG
jgi:hypothetical protein